MDRQQRLYDTLHLIAKAYKSPKQLKRTSEAEYGLEYVEALEMAYDNMQNEARQAIKGMRRPMIAKEPSDG